jgi:Fanconi anemia group M protein
MHAIADLHEKNSLVAAELVSLGVDVDFKHLKVADYLIGEVAIERKTVSDFINSMINKRLLRQLEELKQYDKRLLIIEGLEEQELYNDHPEGMHGNSIRGMLLHTLLEKNCPIIFTKDYTDTAKFLFLIARRMEKDNKHISLHAKKKAKNFREQKQFIIEAFPGIGPATAKKLLKKFKTITNIINASDEKLKEILKSKTELFKKILNG